MVFEAIIRKLSEDLGCVWGGSFGDSLRPFGRYPRSLSAPSQGPPARFTCIPVPRLSQDLHHLPSLLPTVHVPTFYFSAVFGVLIDCSVISSLVPLTLPSSHLAPELLKFYLHL